MERSRDVRTGRRVQCGAEERALGVRRWSGWWIRRLVDAVMDIEGGRSGSTEENEPITLIVSPGLSSMQIWIKDL